MHKNRQNNDWINKIKHAIRYRLIFRLFQEVRMLLLNNIIYFDLISANLYADLLKFEKSNNIKNNC